MGEAALQIRIHNFKYALKAEREGDGHQSIWGNLLGNGTVASLSNRDSGRQTINDGVPMVYNDLNYWSCGIANNGDTSMMRLALSVWCIPTNPARRLPTTSGGTPTGAATETAYT